jgi:hypothetical protein
LNIIYFVQKFKILVPVQGKEEQTNNKYDGTAKKGIISIPSILNTLFFLEMGNLNGLVIQLGLQLLILGHLPYGLHEILIDDILPLSSVK